MRRCLTGGILGVLVVVLTTRHSYSEDPGALRLGVANTLFRDIRESMIDLTVQPLSKLLISQSGLAGKVEKIAEPLTVAQLLDDRKLDLAILHGFEFAWARQKYPELRPLVIVSNAQRNKALLVVAADSQFKGCEDLHGKTLALPRRSKEHVHLFLERRCICNGKTAKEHFGKITTPTRADYALDDVAEGEVHAALVDQSQLEAYRTNHADKAAKLRVLLESETFPTGVIAYRQGALPEETIQRIRAGMLRLHETREGKELLSICSMAGFEAAPANFEQSLQVIARAYPPPGR